jgi:spermidine/putrescine transport system substrate-binding protein
VGVNGSRRALRLAILLLLAVGLGVLLSGCGGSSTPAPSSSGTGQAQLTGNLTIFAYEDGLVKPVLGGFKRANPGLTIRTAAFGSNDEAVAKIRGGFQADVINVCVEETPRMVRLGLLQPLDTSRIKDWNSIFPAVRALNGVVLDGKVYMVPTSGGTGGILYNPKLVPQGVPSWKALFEDPALRGKITVEDTPATVIPIAALALGYKDPFHLTDDDLAKVQQYLIAHKSQIRTFFNGDADFLNLYKTGEIAAGFAWHDYRATARREGTPAVYVVPTEGQLTWVCGYGISPQTKNLDAAYAALSWYNSPQPQSFYAKSYTYWVFNSKTLQVLPQGLIKTIGLDKPEQLQKSIPLVIPDNYDKWVKVFQAVKMANG